MEQISEQELKAIFIDKLEQSGGEAVIPMLKGHSMTIRLLENNNGIERIGKFKFKCSFQNLYTVYEKIIALGGKMNLGANEAHAGHRIGSEKLPVDTMAAFIAIEFYGKKIGDKTLRLSSYYSTLLDWAGVATKHGGKFITVP